MKPNQNIITVFEHETLKLNKELNLLQLDALEKFYGEKGVPYYTLINKGIKFNEHVGVIQVGNMLIEVLPKADKNSSDDENKQKWRNILIAMLRAVGIFDIHAPTCSSLKLKPNSILDLYVELFLNEVEYLLHQGLVKKYRKKEGNSTALKGNLHFAKHIRQNLTHQERFYVRFSTYDAEHIFHFILYKTICLLKQINTNTDLQSRVGALLLCFPEMPDIKVTEATFNNLVFNRKTESYRHAIEIAKLLLLNYHPDISNGRNNVLAIMFDMNKLWEKFVYVSLRKHKTSGILITAQNSKYFWKPGNGNRVKIRPDIVITHANDSCTVLDTKWKNLNDNNPSPDDLRQMYSYGHYFTAKKRYLLYPGVAGLNEGSFYNIDGRELSVEEKCGLLFINPIKEDNTLNKEIGEEILEKLI